MFRADLHCHTTCSDGALSPEELITKGKEQGLSALSITDHDTVAAYNTAYPLARNAGLLLGTGVEFSASHFSKSVHVLGYAFDLTSSVIHEHCAQQQMRRRERNHHILERCRRLSIYIKEEELLAMGISIGRVHIAKKIVEKGYAKDIKMAFHNYLGDGKSCYVPLKTVSVEETIEKIHQANGKAFFAHPHLTHPKKDLLSLPFDGIECYYALFSPQQERKWLRIAEKNGWLISGGSDFHGKEKRGDVLGSSWVDESWFTKIFPHLTSSTQSGL